MLLWIMSVVSNILVFQLLFALLMIKTVSAVTKYENNNYRLSKQVLDGKDKLMKCEITNVCELFCFQQENITAVVEATIVDEAYCAFIGYHLHLYFPKITIINRGWLITNAIIKKITIRDGESIVAIQPGAFDDSTFELVSEIELRGTAIRILQMGIFDGLHSLKSLSLYSNNQLKVIEQNALRPLHQLEVLVIEDHKMLSDLINVTGTIEWKYLHSLILSRNSFRSIIIKETFEGCSRVKILNLSNSAIEDIGPESFDSMAKIIEILDLSNNRLKHLPSLLLANMIRPNLKLYLANNLWNCDCDCLELKGYDINNSTLIIDSPLICESPQSQKESEMRNVNHNECLTTTKSTTLFISTTAAVTEAPTYLDRFKCDNQNDPYASDYMSIETDYQYFNIKQETMNRVSIEINYPDPSLAVVLINNHEYEAKCQYDLKRKMIFDALNPNAGYLFCLIKKSSYSTSPRNCLPFHFVETSSIWIRHKIAITLVCPIMLAFILVVIGWLLVLRHRRFTKSKEVLRYLSPANSRSKIVLEELNASIASDYHREKFIIDINNNGANLRRSHSENSLNSCKSYMTPSSFEITQWKNERNCKGYHTRNYRDKLEYDLFTPSLPPPLPPYHSTHKDLDRIYETIIEPVCVCQNETVPYNVAYMHRPT